MSNSMCSYVKRNPLLPCYIFLFAGLLVCGLYDVCLIIYSFVDENRVTEIRLVSNETCPFLEDVSVRVKIRDRLSLRETWEMEEHEFNAYKSVVALPPPDETVVLASLLEGSLFRLPLEYKWAMLQVRDIISQFEYNLLNYTYLDNTTFILEQKYSENASYWLKMTDIFLENYEAYEVFDEYVMSSIRNDLSEVTPYVYDDYTKVDFSQFVLPVQLPTADPTATAAVYELGPPDYKDSEFYNAPLTVTLHVPYKSLSRKGYMVYLEAKKDRKTQIWLTVTNNGVFDRSAFPPCREQDLDEYHCTFDCNARLLAEYCDCIPFTYRKLFDIENKMGNRSFCTLERYKKCLSRNYEERRSRCKTFCAVPQCIVTKNDYLLSTTTSYTMAESSQPQYPFTLLVRCPAKTHVWFVDKRRNTRFQLLAQMGGDLGLLVTFGLLTIWILVNKICCCKTDIANHKRRSTVSHIFGADARAAAFEENDVPVELRMKILEIQMMRLMENVKTD